MPFTFSHPAIILPLSYLPRKWISLTGLIIGSLTPDFEYFLRMKVESIYSHKITGIFWFDLPLGILIAFVFHTIVRNALISNLPIQIKKRMVNYQEFNWIKYFKSNWIVVMISLLIGIASHIFWDGFTHNHGYFVEIIPLLKTKLNFLNLHIPIFKILQHSSSLIGGVFIIFAFRKLPITKIEKSRVNPKYWLVLGIITLIIIVFRFLTGLELREYGAIVITMISATLIGMTSTPLLMNKL